MLLIEQNLGVAIDVADTVDVMVNGRIARSMPAGRAGRRPRAAAAAARREGAARTRTPATTPAPRGAEPEPDEVTVYTVRRAGDDATPARAARPMRPPSAPCAASRAGTRPIRRRAPRDRLIDGRAEPATPVAVARPRPPPPSRTAAATRAGRRVPGGRHRRARRLRRRHLRHQGPRALLPAQLPGEARAAHGHRRSRDLGQAVAGDDPSARGRAAPSARASAPCSPATAAPR